MRPLALVLLLCANAAHAQKPAPAAAFRIDTVAGSGVSLKKGQWATQTSLRTAYGITFDNSGALLVADTMGNRIWRVTADGRIAALAGSGKPGAGGDGGPATEAELNSPRDIALAPSGEIYITDNGKIRVISPDGIIRSLEIEPVDYGPLQPPNPVELRDPTLLTYAPETRRLYVCEFDRVRYLDEAGRLHAFAGGGKEAVAGAEGPAGLAVHTNLGSPRDIALAAHGSIYISQTRPPRIMRVDDNGRIRSFYEAEKTVPVDKAGGVLWMESIVGLAFDPAGRLYFSDQVGGHIWALEHTGALTLITPSAPGQARGPLYFPTSLALTPQGEIYVSQLSLGVVRKLREGDIGEIVAGAVDLQVDGGLATEAQLFHPSDVAFDSAGNLYIADRDNAVVRRVNPEGRIERFAGNGTRHPDEVYDGRPAPDVALGFVMQVAADADGVYTLGNYRVRAIRADRSVEHLITIPHKSFAARLSGVQPDGAGRYYVSSFDHRQIYRFEAKTGRRRWIAGNGESGYAVSGELARSSPLLAPLDMTLDPDGNLYVVDGSREIHRISPDEILTTIAARPRPVEGKAEPLRVADLEVTSPRALAWGPDDALYIADGETIRRITWPEGGAARIETVAGDGAAGFAGDGGPALQARFNYPTGLAFDSSGRLFVADRNNHRIRVLTPIRE